ncbi:MAG: hypothetical protein ABIJ46_00315 [bacterium]
MALDVMGLMRDRHVWRMLAEQAVMALEDGLPSRRLLGLVLDTDSGDLACEHAVRLLPDHDWSSSDSLTPPTLVGICPDWFRDDLLAANSHLHQKIDAAHRSGSFLVLTVALSGTGLWTLPLPRFGSWMQSD